MGRTCFKKYTETHFPPAFVIDYAPAIVTPPSSCIGEQLDFHRIL
jgi:hypothetical protein